MGTIIAVCISKTRGTQKQACASAQLIADWGIQGDAHAGCWHRQVSLLAAEEIDAFNAQGAGVQPGAFGENLIVRGIDLRTLPVGTRLRCGSALLELTQIGKECHTHCAIYQKMGDCIMPREGVFARVLTGGAVQPGDAVDIVPRTAPLPLQAAVITLSDRCAAGERTDHSGPAVAARLADAGFTVAVQHILPDDRAALERTLIDLCDRRQLDLILTTGGTGFAPRDITPEATRAVAERDAPGIAEAIRAASMRITPRAMLSRAVSVIRGKTLIINLPGSPKACQESMDVFLDQLPHALELLRGIPQDCGR